MKTILVDDEPNNNESLKFLLERYCPGVKICGIAENVQQAEEMISGLRPDLVFLDIEMPYGNAFELLNRLSPVYFAVVFVTAFDSYAIKAIKYSALDYLLKPVGIPDLKNAVHRASGSAEKMVLNSQVNALLANISIEKATAKIIGLPFQDGMDFEKIADITYLAASGNYTIVHTVKSRKYTLTKTLKDFEELLPAGIFCRIHHSYLVNIEFIKKYHKGRGGYIEMADGTEIDVSVRKKEEFLSKFA